MTRVLPAGLLCLIMVVGAYAQTPPTPTNLTAVQVNSLGRASVKLAWHGPRGPWSFRISRSANDTLHYETVGMTADTAFLNEFVTVGTRYYYYVRSFSMGGGESGRSNVANILITPPPPPPPPPTPTDLTARLVVEDGDEEGEVSVGLTWSAPLGPWRFKVFRSTSDTLHYHFIESERDTSANDEEVRLDSTYNYYVVSASLDDSTVSGRSNVASIHVIVPPRVRGTIRGTVTDSSTHAPLRNVVVQFFRSSHEWDDGWGRIRTDSLGHYSALLDTGRYIARASAPRDEDDSIRYLPQFYYHCPEPSCATVIVVAESSTFTADFSLLRVVPPSFANVSGTVSDTLNHPLRNARVSVIRTMQEMNYLGSLGLTPGRDEEFDLEGVGDTRGVVWTGYTDSLGRYRARVVADRDYIALASKQGYLPQYFDHKPTVQMADIIHVTHDTAGISFNLSVRPVPNNSISGIVRDSMGTHVPSRIILIPVGRGPEPHGTRYGHTDSLGAYMLTQVEAGRYFVLAIPFSNFGPAFYKAGAYGVIRIQDADTVNISGNVTGINIGVRQIMSAGLALLHGTVISSTSEIVPGVRLTALDAQGAVLGIGVTDGSGSYDINAVAPGAVTIVADREGYQAAQLDVVVNPDVYSINDLNLTLTPDSPTSVGGPGVPVSFTLSQNYPNPFNPTTKITYALPASGFVTLKVFNILGQEVATLVNDYSAAGTFVVNWNGTDNLGRSVASGVYIYRLNATAGSTEFSQVRKMLLLR